MARPRAAAEAPKIRTVVASTRANVSRCVDFGGGGNRSEPETSSD